MRGRIVTFLIASNLILLAGLIIAVIGNPYTARAQTSRTWTDVNWCSPGGACTNLLSQGYEPFAVAKYEGQGMQIWMRK